MEISPHDLADLVANRISTNVLGGKYYDSHDLMTFASLYSSMTSAKYYCEQMSTATNYENDLALLTHAMEMRQVDGLVLEFGVWSGRTINHISSLTRQTVYGFDGFTGLPETWRTGAEKGVFGRNDLPEVNGNVELVVGLFEDTLDDFLDSAHDQISLLHIDCDLYSSTKTVFEKLGDRIIPGTIVVFDEYLNYVGWEHHEFKAFAEFVQQRGLNYHYDSFVSWHTQVCVVID